MSEPCLITPYYRPCGRAYVGGCTGTNLPTMNTCYDWIQDANEGYVDTQPDMFNFNFAGYSGKFIFYKGRPLILGGTDIKIEYAPDLSSWTLTAPNGVKFFFGGEAATENTYFDTGGWGTRPENRRSTSYYLTRIESMNGGHFIEFNYESEDYSTSSVTGQTVAVNCDVLNGSASPNSNEDCPITTGSAVASASMSGNKTRGKRLSSIVTSSGKVRIDFIANHVREDLLQLGSSQMNTQSKALDEIRITKGSFEQSFDLSHGYFQAKTVGFGFSGLPDEIRRLKLNSVTQHEGGQTLNPYIFEYDESELLPRRNSLARDHWGYYNGNDGATGLIPSNTTCPCIDAQGTAVDYGVGNSSVTRDPDANKMQIGILKKITFPTKGFTQFVYGSHMYNGQVVGGLRIEKIISDPNDGNTPIEKDYLYEQAALFAGYPDASSYVHESVSHFGYNISNPNTEVACADFIVMGNPRSALRTAQGYHIGYGKVTISQTGNGSQIFYYHNPTQLPFATYDPYPSIPPENDLMGGMVLKEEVKDESGNLLMRKEYDYETVDLGIVDAWVMYSYDAGTMECASGQAVQLTPYSKINYRKYTWKPGFVRMIEETTWVDGLETEKTMSYTDPANHSQPVSESMINSDQSTLVTESRYFEDYGMDFSGIQIDHFSCLNQFLVDMSTLRADLGAGNISKLTYNLQVGYRVNNYITCMETEWNDYDQAREALINAVATTDPELAELVRRNVITPLEVNQKREGSLIAGSKLEYALESFPSSTTPHLLPSTYYMADVTTPGNYTWRKTNEVSFNAYDHILDVEKEDAQTMSYLWYKPRPFTSDQTLSMPLAKAINAAENQIAYTSFEATLDNKIASAGWTINGSSNNQTTTIGLTSGIKETESTMVFSHDGSAVDVTLSLISSASACHETGSLLRVRDLTTNLYTDHSIVNGSIIPLNPGNYTFQLFCGCGGSSCTNGAGSGFSPDLSISLDIANTTSVYEGWNHQETAQTGGRVFKLYNQGGGQQNTIVSKSLPEGRYKVSFWYKGSPIRMVNSNGTNTLSHTGSDPSQLTYFEQEVDISANGTLTLEIGSLGTLAYVDELRLHPVGAQMETYCYDHALRLHTQTDANHRSSYYRYDGFSRLKTVQDQNKHFVQGYEYNFKN
ncbi:MAG: hypothetical protein AAFW00_21260 [Bacteroidota bacterium]